MLGIWKLQLPQTFWVGTAWGGAGGGAAGRGGCGGSTLIGTCWAIGGVGLTGSTKTSPCASFSSSSLARSVARS